MVKSYKVLVADDDLDHVTIVRTILEQHGYEAMEAFDGEETLRVVEHRSPDLVLLDIMMPKIDGLEVVRRLKDNPRTRDLPVIMFSAKSGTREIMESFNYGASNYLIKPIDAARLLEKIEATLRKEEFRENIEKHYRAATEVESDRAPSRDAERMRERLASLVSVVNDFLSAVEGPLEVVQKEISQMSSSPRPEREVRLAAKKLDAIAAICSEIRDLLAEVEEI